MPTPDFYFKVVCKKGGGGIFQELMVLQTVINEVNALHHMCVIAVI